MKSFIIKIGFLILGTISVLSDCYGVQDQSDKYVTFEKNGKLAIFSKKDKKQCTDYIFDAVYGSPYIAPKRHVFHAGYDATFPRFGLTLVRKDGAFAFLDEEFKEFLPYGTYDSIIPMNYLGYTIVRKNNKWGILDSKCNLKTPLIFDMITQTPRVSYENDFKSFLVQINRKFRILDKNTNWTIRLDFDSVDILSDNFYYAHLGNENYLINDDCKILSNQYSAVYETNDGFIVKKNRKMGVVDYMNNIEIPIEFDSIYYPRLENYFFAFKHGKCGVIDLKGKMIIPFEYEHIGEAWEDHVKKENQHLIVMKNDKMGTISFKNEIIIPIDYDYVSDWIEYGPDAHFVKKDGKYGMMSYFGKILIPVIYDNLNFINNSLIECSKNNKYGVININNEEIIPCTNDSLILDYSFFMMIDEKKDKIIVKNNGVWNYHDMKGRLIQSNVPEEEVRRRK